MGKKAAGANDPDLMTWELQADFQNEPLEDGMNHPAVQTLERWLTPEREEELIQTLEKICRDEQHPALAANTLKCLAGMERRPGTPERRAGFIRTALHSGDMEIREAGVDAAEHWDGEPEILELLRAHQDPTEWIQEYVNGVLADWGKDQSGGTPTGR